MAELSARADAHDARFDDRDARCDGRVDGRYALPRPHLTIDVHTHIMPDILPDLKSRYGVPGWVSLQKLPCGKRARMMRDDGTPFREVEDSLWSAPRRLADCDRARVRAHVLSTVPVLFSYWAPTDAAVDFSRLLNDHMIESVKAAPARFVGLGTLPMQSPRHAVDELRRCVAGGLAGVQIGSHVNSLPLSDASFFPVFEAAAELGAAVFVHPWDMMGAELMKDYWLSWLVGMPAETTLAMCSLMMGGVLERLPALRVCFAHGGGSFAATLGRIEHGWAVRPDLCQVAARASPAALCAARRVWVDSLVHEPRALDTIVRTFGAERVCLGTDYPFVRYILPRLLCYLSLPRSCARVII